MSDSSLFAPVCSITATRRRRFLWAAWWTRRPERSPFVKPDASEGGARTREEALASAEKAAGCRLTLIDGSWARAWARVLVGDEPFSGRRDEAVPKPANHDKAPESPHFALLGLTPRASDEEVKRAYRSRALETHPDRGGSAEAFRAVHAAFEHISKRRARAPKKRR
ncbi:MAG TPA: J domain-containing protein [Polyangiaceae bacterium]|nr:J domain-containing protein [Polyangiaceae bacterium]